MACGHGGAHTALWVIEMILPATLLTAFLSWIGEHSVAVDVPSSLSSSAPLFW